MPNDGVKTCQMTELEYATIYLSISYTNNKCIQKTRQKNINFTLKKNDIFNAGETSHSAAKLSVYSVLLLFVFFFLAKILPCAFLSREALSYLLNRQIMDFKLPHDILCRRAAHDNRRADGGLPILLPQESPSPTNSSE